MASEDEKKKNPKEGEKAMTTTQKIGLPLAIVVFLIVWFFPVFGEMDLRTRHTLAVMFFTVVLWITRPWMPALSGMIFMVLVAILGLASVRNAFSGFSSTTPWFIWAALVIALAIKESKMGLRIAYSLLKKIPPTTKSVLGLHFVIAWLLSYIIPSSTARVAAVAPIGAAQIESLGLPLKSQAGKMLMSSMVLVNFMCAQCLLTGGSVPIAAWGALREAGIYISWLQWWLYFIVPLFVGMLVFFFGLWILFRPEKANLSADNGNTVRSIKDLADNVLSELGPISNNEKKVAGIVGLLLVLWATEPLHGVSSDLIGIAAGIIMFLPGVGVLKAKDSFRKVGWNTVVFVAAAMSIGTVTEETGVADFLGSLLNVILNVGNNEFVFLLMFLVLGFFGRFFLRSGAANVAVLLIPTLTIAASHGYNATMLGLCFPICLGGLFIYQHTFGLIAYDYGTFEEPDFVKAALIRYLAIIVMMAVGYFVWWPLVGLR